MIIGNEIFDLTPFLEEHPGGMEILLEFVSDLTSLLPLSQKYEHNHSRLAAMRPMPLNLWVIRWLLESDSTSLRSANCQKKSSSLMAPRISPRRRLACQLIPIKVRTV